MSEPYRAWLWVTTKSLSGPNSKIADRWRSTTDCSYSKISLLLADKVPVYLQGCITLTQGDRSCKAQQKNKIHMEICVVGCRSTCQRTNEILYFKPEELCSRQCPRVEKMFLCFVFLFPLLCHRQIQSFSPLVSQRKPVCRTVRVSVPKRDLYIYMYKNRKFIIHCCCDGKKCGAK